MIHQLAGFVNSEGRSVQDTVAAETKSIGFDYQYYYFLLKVIQLEKGETVGYEVKDDVHIDNNNGELILIQLKHSIDNKSNLTEKDVDLWKTISNWIKIVNDENEGRTSLEDQINYINKTTFLLVTNKGESSTNKFLELIEVYQNHKVTLSNIKEHLGKISKPISEKDASKVDGYISFLLSQNDSWLEHFFGKLRILMKKESLIEEVKQAIKQKNVKESRVDDVFASVDSNLRTFMFKTVTSRCKVNMNFETYYQRFTKYFELGRSTKLPIRPINMDVSLPSNFRNHTFVRQLLDSEIISEDDAEFEDELISYFTSMMYMHNNEKEWLQKSEITKEELMALDKEAEKRWKNTFKRIHSELQIEFRKNGKDISKIDEEKLNILARNCYYAILDILLVLDDTELDTELCNGKFYSLSDYPSIGWRFDWREKYTND